MLKNLIFGKALLKSLFLCLSILCLVALFQGEVAWLLMLMKCNVHPHKCESMLLCWLWSHSHVSVLSHMLLLCAGERRLQPRPSFVRPRLFDHLLSA